MSLVDFAAALWKRNIKHLNGTKCAIIFDSTPAPATLPLVIRAFTASMRSRLQRYVMAIVLTVVYAFTTALRIVTRRREATVIVMEHLNDPDLLPWTSIRTPRMYFYSTGDKIVPASAVEEHAAQARMAGIPVQMVNYGKSDHVSHARDYPDRYWEAVRLFWMEASE